MTSSHNIYAFNSSRPQRCPAAALFSEEDIAGLQNILLKNPDAGDLIPGGRGLRKLRVPLPGRGKRGGVRVQEFPEPDVKAIRERTGLSQTWQSAHRHHQYRLPGKPAPPLKEPPPGEPGGFEHLPAPDFDGVWKEALRQWLPECLELFWPHVHSQVNWRVPPVFLDKELKQLGHLVKRGTRHVDVLAQLRLLSGEDALLLVHLEVQGGAIGPSFSERMLHYHVRIRERHSDQPVLSCAILLDREHGPDTERYAESAFGCEHNFSFPVVNLAAWRARMAELQAMAAHNPVAVVVLAKLETRATQPDGTRLASKFALARALLRQLTRRFGPLSQETLDRLKTATAAQLETWSLNLLDAPALQDVFRD